MSFTSTSSCINNLNLSSDKNMNINQGNVSLNSIDLDDVKLNNSITNESNNININNNSLDEFLSANASVPTENSTSTTTTTAAASLKLFNKNFTTLMKYSNTSNQTIDINMAMVSGNTSNTMPTNDSNTNGTTSKSLNSLSNNTTTNNNTNNGLMKRQSNSLQTNLFQISTNNNKDNSAIHKQTINSNLNTKSSSNNKSSTYSSSSNATTSSSSSSSSNSSSNDTPTINPILKNNAKSSSNHLKQQQSSPLAHKTTSTSHPSKIPITISNSSPMAKSTSSITNNSNNNTPNKNSPSTSNNNHSTSSSNFQHEPFNIENELIKYTKTLKLNPNSYLTTYKLGQHIRNGGFSEIYEGLNLKTNQNVIIKLIPKHKTKNWLMVHNKKYPAEILLHKMSNNINGVVKMLEFYEQEQEWVITMPKMINCMDLFDYLESKQRGRLNEFEACHFFKQLVKINMDLLQQGVVHRDIKSENLLVDLDTMKLILIDFGASAIYRHNNNINSQQHYYSDFHGTRQYKPPEYILNKKYTAQASTIWTLGILLYDMCNGQLPFETEQEILEYNLQIKASVSDEYRKLLFDCLNQDPNKRPTLADLLESEWCSKFSKSADEQTINVDIVNNNPLEIPDDDNDLTEDMNTCSSTSINNNNNLVTNDPSSNSNSSSININKLNLKTS